MYRGLGPTLLGYLPTWAIYFAVYDTIKDYFGKQSLREATSTRHVYPAAQAKGYQPLSRDHPWALHLFSAMAAGATSTVCTTPLWVIKTRFMVRKFMSRIFSQAYQILDPIP
jgi:solute carrier family 25 (mitochondrial folate transporter), member 32